MTFTLDPQTEKITFGVVSDGTHNGIARAIADIFGASESFKDDFSTYLDQSEADTAWVPQDTPDNQVDVTNDNYFYTVIRDGTNIGTSHDLGAGNVSDTKWVLRCKVVIGSPYVVTSTLSAGIRIGLSDTDSSVGVGGINDDITISLVNTTIGGGREHVGGDVVGGTSSSTSGSNTVFVAGETVYLEMVRLSSISMKTTVYTDANYTVVRDSITRAISSSITGLRYIKMGGPTDVTGWDGTFTGTIDDVQFWDGVTEPQILTNDWRIRFKLDLTNLDDGANAVDKRLYMLMTDEDVTSDSNNAQDSLGLLLRTDNAITNFSIIDTNGTSPINASADSTFATAPSVSTFFVEIIRSTASDYEVSLYPDSTFTTPTETEVGSVSVNTVGLRYLKFMNESTLTGAGAIDGTIDDIQFVDLTIMAVTKEFEFEVNAIIKRTGDVLCAGTGPPVATFTEDFTTNAGWTYTGSFPAKLSVDSISFPDVLRLECFRSTAVDGSQHIEKSMGVTINEGDSQTGDIVFEFDHNHIAPCDGFSATNAMFSLTEDAINIGDNRATKPHLTYRTTSITDGNPGIQGQVAEYGDGVNLLIITSEIALVNNTQYFPRITKFKNGTLQLEIFTDSGRTNHTAGSPVSVDASSIANKELKNIQLSSAGGGGNGRKQRADFDNVSVVENDGCPTVSVDALIQSQGTCGESTKLFDQIAGNSGLWTSNTSQIVIDSGGSGIVEMNALVGGGTTTSRRAFRSLDSSFPANIGKITMRQKITKISGNLETALFMVIQNGTGDASIGSPIPQMFIGQGSGVPAGFFASVSDGAGGGVNTTPQLAFLDGQTRFAESIYDPISQTLTFNVYSDAGFSVHIAGSPIQVDASAVSMPSTLIDTVLSSNFTNSGGARVITADLDDYTVFVGSCPAFQVDSLAQASPQDLLNFKVNAILVDRFDEEFEVNALIQAQGDDGTCPIPATVNIYSTPNSLSLAERQGGGTNRAGEQVIDATHVGEAIEDVEWFLRRNGTGATGSLFATVRNASDDIISTSTNSVLAQSLPTGGAGIGITFTFPERIVLQQGDRILLEFPNCIGCGASSPNVFMFGVAGPPPAGWNRTFWSIVNEAYNAPEDNQDFHQSGNISKTTSSAVPGEQRGCASVNAILQASPQSPFEFTVDGIPFIPPAVLFLVDSIVRADNQEKEFFVDSCLRSPFAIDFDLDACIQRQKNEGEFEVDGHVFILPVRNVLVDAIVRYAQGSSLLGAIPDLIIRALRENPPSLTGRGIVDKVVEITTGDPTISFTGKTSRIKNWISRLERDQLIQQDNSDPDWFETNWELGPLGLPLP